MSYVSVVTADSPLGYWRLNDASGTTAVATVGTNMTYSGSPTLGQTGPGTIGDTAVKFAQASSQLAEGGAGNQVNVVDTFTFEAWVKMTDYSQSESYIAYTANNGAYISVTNGGAFVLAKQFVARLFTSTFTISDTNTFHYVVVTKSGTTVKLYVDSVDRTPTITNLTFVSGVGNQDNISGAANSARGDATIGQVAFYNTALTPAQVTAHYGAGTTSAGKSIKSIPGAFVAAMVHARTAERKHLVQKPRHPKLDPLERRKRGYG